MSDEGKTPLRSAKLRLQSQNEINGDVDSNRHRKGSDCLESGSEEPAPITWRSWRFFKLLYLAVISGVLYLINGNAAVFSSPLLDEIIRNANSTPWVEGFSQCFYQSLIGPSVFIGGAFGSIFSPPLMSIFGLVLCLTAGSVLHVGGWAMIGLSWFLPSPSSFRGLILTGRFVTGLAMGLIFSVWPVYIGELSPSEYRAFFMAFGLVFFAVGVSETYLLSSFLPYWLSAFIYSGTTAALIPFLVTLPESPLRTRNIAKNFKLYIQSFKSQTGILTRGVSKGIRPFLNRFIMTDLITLMNVHMGYYVITQYAEPILDIAGASKWSVPHGVLVAGTVGFSEIVGASLSSILSKYLGRINCCVIGAISMFLGHTGIAVYFILIDGLGPHSTGEIVSGNVSVSELCFFKPAINSDLGEKYSPLALISLTFLILFFSMFWLLQPFLIAVELFTDDTRGLGFGINMCLYFTNIIALSFLFPVIENEIGPALSFLFFAFICALAAILIPTLVPETKGRPAGERGDKFTVKRNWVEFLKPFEKASRTTFIFFKCQLNRVVKGKHTGH